MTLPTEKQTLLDTLTARLAAVPGVVAVVLGGSYARGTARPDSDLDLGIYYAEQAPFSIDDIREVAAAVSTAGVPDVTDFYAWGPWVNGGAWLQTAGGRVDFLFRSLDQVRRTIDDASRGIVYHDFNQQPAFGFYSVIYLAETHICVPLYDPHGEIAALKELVAVYPPLLKEKSLSSYLWLAEFTLLHAAGYAGRGDVYAATGSLARAASYLTQALFALNETYFINDKTAMKEIAAFRIAPPGCVAELARILAHPGATPSELTSATRAMHALWSKVVALVNDTGGSYKPAFKVL